MKKQHTIDELKQGLRNAKEKAKELLKVAKMYKAEIKKIKSLPEDA